MARDFFNPRKKSPTTAQTRLAHGLSVADPRWAGPSRPLPYAPRPRPIFADLTESEIELSLAMMRGGCGDD
jgi:hypothetical protein